jgi:hypothetical protein
MVTYEDIETAVEYSEQKGYIGEFPARGILEAVKIGRETPNSHYTPDYIINGPLSMVWGIDKLAKDILRKINQFSERLRDEGREVEGGMLPPDAMGVEPIIYPAIRVLLTALNGRLEMSDTIRQRFEGMLEALNPAENKLRDFQQENKSYNNEKPSWWNIVKTF